jgi:hypothetical protein
MYVRESGPRSKAGTSWIWKGMLIGWSHRSVVCTLLAELRKIEHCTQTNDATHSCYSSTCSPAVPIHIVNLSLFMFLSWTLYCVLHVIFFLPIKHHPLSLLAPCSECDTDNLIVFVSLSKTSSHDASVKQKWRSGVSLPTRTFGFPFIRGLRTMTTVREATRLKHPLDAILFCRARARTHTHTHTHLTLHFGRET